MRISKQLLYGFMYLLVFSLIGLAVYRIYFYVAPTCFDNIQNQKETAVDCGGPCVSCIIKNAQLEKNEVDILNAGDGKITLLAKIKNPIDYSAVFEYKIDVIGFGVSLHSEIGTSSVNPNGERYIVIPGLALNSKDVSRVVIEVLDTKWNEKADERLSNVKLENSGIVFTDDEIRISGMLTNNSLDLTERARVTAILLNDESVILSASAVDVTNIRPSGEKSFTIFFPKISGTEFNQELIQSAIFTEIIRQQQ